MRLALLSPLPPEHTRIADYAAHFRASLNQAGVDVLTPLAGQRPIDTLAAARAWVAERDWRRVDVVHAELGRGRHSEFLTLCALAALPDRPALSATVHDPDRLIWGPVNKVWALVNGLSALPHPAKQAVALLSDPATLMAERKLARQLDGLVTLTQTGADRLIKRMSLPADRVSVIAHGARNVPAKPLPSMDTIRLLYLGAICAGKGIEDLIDALGQVKAKQPELASRLRLSIVGGSPPKLPLGTHGGYLDQLRGHLQRRGLSAQIEWEPDVDERDIAALVQRHHLMVLPYRESRQLALLGQMHGTSAALAWAVACGRGAITSDTRAFAEEISHGNGASYKQGDVNALATLIEGVLLKPEILPQWADCASTLAHVRAWRLTGQRFVGHFQRGMAGGARAKVAHGNGE
jgi:glycosyltransferase involved in cell wall biosynthesis